MSSALSLTFSPKSNKKLNYWCLTKSSANNTVNSSRKALVFYPNKSIWNWISFIISLSMIFINSFETTAFLNLMNIEFLDNFDKNCCICGYSFMTCSLKIQFSVTWHIWLEREHLFSKQFKACLKTSANPAINCNDSYTKIQQLYFNKNFFYRSCSGPQCIFPVKNV